jgi:ATP-dependent helicase/nuclease subunit A
VRTFHAWFAQLLRRRPLELLAELGLQPDMALVEDPTEHRPDVYRRFHAAVAAEASLREDFDALVRRRGRAAVRKWLDIRVGRSAVDQRGSRMRPGRSKRSIPAPVARQAHRRRHCRAGLWQQLLSELAAATGARVNAAAQKAADKLVVALALARCEQAVRGRGGRRLFTTTDVPRKLGAADGLAAAHAGLQDSARPGAASTTARDEHLRMVRLVRTLLAEYAAYKRSRGWPTWPTSSAARLRCCATARSPPGCRSGLDARVRHLLIDEFQDTSPLQWHALHAWLAGYAGAGGGASGQQPPGIFIVGDPKQSIYRFRGAEPRVFDAARDFVVEAPRRQRAGLRPHAAQRAAGAGGAQRRVRRGAAPG